MFEVAKLIQLAAQRASDEKFVVAAPYDLADFLCRDIAANGTFGGYIANSAPDPNDRNPLIAGWWVDRGEGIWFIRPSMVASTVILLGASTHQRIGADLLLEARRKGVRQLLLVDADGTVLRAINPSSYSCPVPSDTMSQPLGDLSYEKAFNEIFGRIGNKLRLPAESFESKRVLLLVGSLGPGGAERQAAYTASGLMRTRAYEVYVGCNYVERHPDNLFRPVVKSSGAKIEIVADDPPEYNTPSMILARQRLAPFDSISVQNIFHAILQYASMIRKVRPALVHTWTDYCNVFAGIAAELVGVPKLVLGGRSLAPDNCLFHPYMRPGYLSLLRRRSAVFLHNSRAGAGRLCALAGFANWQFKVIHNGFDFPADRSVTGRRVVRSAYGIEARFRCCRQHHPIFGREATAALFRHGAGNPCEEPANPLPCIWGGADAGGDACPTSKRATLRCDPTARPHSGRLGGSRGDGHLCADLTHRRLTERAN